jgi:hypothetical protein
MPGFGAGGAGFRAALATRFRVWANVRWACDDVVYDRGPLWLGGVEMPEPPGGTSRAEVAGSRRSPLPGAVRADRVPAGTSVDVLVQVRRRRPLPTVESLGDRYPLSREEFAETYGAHPDDMAAARAFAESHGLRVRSTGIGTRLLVLTGAASQFEDAFGVELVRSVPPGT